MTVSMKSVLILFAWLHVTFARCPNWCNKRGECSSPSEGGYCVCHFGFTGEDCSQRLCPAGFDPLGLEALPNRRTIRLEAGHMGGLMMGKYSFGFAGSEVYLPANANDNDDAKCTSAMKGLASASSVTCKRETYNVDTGTGTYLITFNAYPEKPYMNNIIHHNGNPAINLFSCNASKIDNEEAQQPFCFVSNAEPFADFPLYAECGNHGVCDRVGGVCDCERGFKGDVCIDTLDSEDIYEHIHDGPFFTGSVVKINAQRTPSEVFNLFQAQLDGANVTTIRGDRLLQHKGDVHVLGGLEVQQAGAGVGSAVITNIKSIIDRPIITARTISSDTSQQQQEQPHHHHMLAYHNKEVAFALTATGDATIAGTLEVCNHSLTVAPHLITGHNLRLSNDLHVLGSANVEESLTIGTGFALNPGGMTVDVASHSGTLFELRSRQVGFNGTLMELNSVGEDSTLIRAVSNGMTAFELHTSGDVKMNGLRLASGGIQVQSGGIDVEAGGVMVQGGLSILSGGLTLEQQPFSVGTLHADGTAGNLVDPLLSASATSKHYAGHMLSLTGPTEGGEKMKFLSFQRASSSDVSGGNSTAAASATALFEVKGSGDMDSAGGAVFRGSQGLEVHGSSTLRGRVSLHKVVLVPEVVSAVSDTTATSVGMDGDAVGGDGSQQSSTLRVTVPTTVTYAVIAPADRSSLQGATTPSASSSTVSGSADGKRGVEVVFAAPEGFPSAAAGRVVLVCNLDELTTSGDCEVPPQSTVMMLFDGQRWVSVDALKAPMHVLQHVRTLEADNDLNIGNHSFSALRFQATGLRRNSIVFATAEGFLTDSDKFTYTKGVLATPALRVEKLLTDVDARGNDISNAQLSNPKILGASITAKDITLPGLTGLAYFSTKGALTASSSLTLDSEGRLLISEIHSDVKVHGHQLSDLTIHQANLTNIGSIRTGELFLQPSSAEESGLLMVQENGQVVSLKDTVKINHDTGDVAFKSFSAVSLSAPLDTQGHALKNANIQRGSANQLTSVDTADLTVTSLRDDIATDNRLVFVNPQGKLQAQRDTAQMVSIPHLSVQEIRFESSEIDFQGRRLKNMVLDSETFVLGPQKVLEAEEISITGLQKTSASVKSGALLFANSAGKVGASTGLSFSDGVLDLSTSTVSAASVNAQKLILPGTKSTSFLSTTAEGEVVGGSALELDALTARQSVVITAKASLQLQGREPASLVALNAQGELVAVHKPAQKGVAEQGIDAHLHSVEAEAVTADRVAARRAVLQELVLDGTRGQTESAPTASAGSLLVSTKENKLLPVDRDALFIDKGVLHATSILPVSPAAPLLVSSALLTHSNISNSHIHDAHSVVTSLLTVREQAEFLADVVIDGSVTVHGTVIGSGPYVDSSDERFKKNISTLSGALSTVNKLQGVSYEFRTEEYPQRQFPTALQLGFIAQEVQTAAPQLVTEDSEGYLGVAYSHVTVLLTEALKELQAQHDAEMVAVRKEVLELRQMVELLLRKVDVPAK